MPSPEKNASQIWLKAFEIATSNPLRAENMQIRKIRRLLEVWVLLQTYNSNVGMRSSVQFVAQSCLTLCNPMDCSISGLPVHQQLLESAKTHSHWVNDTIQPSHPLLSSSPPAFNLSPHQVLFQRVSSSIRCPNYWSFSFSISPSNEYSGLSFKIYWFDLLAVQETLKSLFQHHRSKASILRCSAFFIVQLSHPYMTNGKTIALTRWTFVGKVTSPLFNMLSRFVIAFLPRSKLLLISWLQLSSAVILEPKKIKSVTASIVSPSICHEVMEPDAMILAFWMLSFKPTFHSPLSLSSRGSLVLRFLPYGWCHLCIWGYWYFSRQSWFQLVLHARHFAWCTLHIS